MWGLLWPCMVSVVVATRLSCSEACGFLVPQLGIEPVSPALQGGFLTIGTPGKALDQILRVRDSG